MTTTKPLDSSIVSTPEGGSLDARDTDTSSELTSTYSQFNAVDKRRPPIVLWMIVAALALWSAVLTVRMEMLSGNSAALEVEVAKARAVALPIKLDQVGGATGDGRFEVGQPQQPVRADGWAIDPATWSGPARVEVLLDGVKVPTRIGLPRVDVSDALREPGLRTSGFSSTLPPTGLNPGSHTLTIRAFAADSDEPYASSSTSVNVVPST